jgi:hypothetical protein
MVLPDFRWGMRKEFPQYQLGEDRENVQRIKRMILKHWWD